MRLETDIAAAPTVRSQDPGPISCFHCGERCGRSSPTKDDHVFCCQGCLVVHDLLLGSGLGQFYQLSQHPGVRVKAATGRERFAYLDQPEVQQRLLDFADDRTGRVTLQVPSVHCVACVWLLENLFRLHPGVGRSQVNFPKREVSIQFAPARIRLSELVSLLASIGYEPSLTLRELDRTKPGGERKRRWLQVGIAGFAFGNIMLFSLPGYLGLDSLSRPLFKAVFGYLSLALAVPVLIFSASDYWRSAWVSMRRRFLTLDVPIALGLLALYAQSATEITTGRGDGYLDSLAGLVFFLLCGRVFQQMTHERLTFDRDYRSFFPLSVARRLPTGTEEMVSISELRVGDRLVLRNRELIPADARLIHGPAFIDYSFVTGESEPLAKTEGEHLYAGGQQIGGAIEVETVKPVSQSYLTSLWNHETFRKSRNDDLDTLTNRYGRRFTAAVIGIAILAAVFWLLAGDASRGVKAFISVLIVACPCALALAAPFTHGTAQRLLARLQVFLRNGIVLERMARVDAIVFDKTGTLTASGTSHVRFVGAPVANPEVRIQKPESTLGPEPPRAKPEPEHALTMAEESWVYSLTRPSTHPHSVRIGESLASRHFPEPVRSFIETPGCGLEGQVEGHELWLGSAAWLSARGAPVPLALAAPSTDGASASASEAPGSSAFLAIDGRFRGAFRLSSPLRPDLDRLVHQLGNRHAIALLSGDNDRERERFRGLFGEAARLHFNQSPMDKLGFIRDLQTSGRTVMMVGDGLNDAGALKQSDVGVAVVERLGAFSPASDVILEAGRVPELSGILRFAEAAARIVRLSFSISAVYNVAGVSIAAAGLLSPVICAVLMPVSSISVVLFACGATNRAARQLARPGPQTGGGGGRSAERGTRRE